jgi:hypothetical protein
VKSGARSVQITEKQRSVHTSHVRLRKHKLIKQNGKKKDNINPSQYAQVTHPSPKRINTRIQNKGKEEIKPHQEEKEEKKPPRLPIPLWRHDPSSSPQDIHTRTGVNTDEESDRIEYPTGMQSVVKRIRLVMPVDHGAVVASAFAFDSITGLITDRVRVAIFAAAFHQDVSL